jgi:hypothetical protein
VIHMIQLRRSEKWLASISMAMVVSAQTRAAGSSSLGLRVQVVLIAPAFVPMGTEALPDNTKEKSWER